jgi:hypothetical protein
MHKFTALILIALLTVSSYILMVEFVSGATKPSTPEFTLEYVDNSYDVPPTYEINQYTGENVKTSYGYRVDTTLLEFTIKNQPFTPYNDINGNYNTLYYNFRFKGSHGDSWSYYTDTSHTYGYYTGIFPDTSASNSDYTVISIPMNSLTNYQSNALEISTGATVEWQVQAIMGYIDYTPTGMLAGGFYAFAGERSDWSSTQIVVIGDSAPTVTTIQPNTDTGVIFGLNWEQLAIVGLCVLVLVLAVTLAFSRMKKR